MKQLVKQLETCLIDKNKSLQINGKELMEVLNIKFEDMNSLCNKWRCELYDNMYIETSTSYAKQMKDLFDFHCDEYWYKEGELDPVYITSGLEEIHESCETFLGDIIIPSEFQHYSVALDRYIKILKDIATDKEIKLAVQYLYDSYVYIFFKNKEIIKVEYDGFTGPEFDDELKNMLLYQLIVLSYDVPLIETLKILELY